MLSKLPLTTLKLKDCEIGNTVCKLSCENISLRQLSIGTSFGYAENCQLTDDGLEALSKSIYLQELHISEKGITLEGFKQLLRMQRLEVLDLPLLEILELDIGKRYADYR